VNDSPGSLRRAMGMPGAVLVGLGSILGTGAFVSLGLAAGIAGADAIPAVILAGLVAMLNGLSSAQLAAAYPVSGGTYEYGHRFLTPALGFAAGWTFLCAKTASAASAALGIAGYALAAVGRAEGRSLLALAVIATVTALVAGGIERTARVNAVVVSATIATLVALVIAGMPAIASHGPALVVAIGSSGSGTVLEASAILFVAYAGYARVATLGEEVREPARVIPAAIVVTLVATMALYAALTAVALATVGPERLAADTARSAAPLGAVGRELGLPRWIVAGGAMTAMLGVLLNLVLGNSRMILAMARHGDMPAALAAIDPERRSPRGAVLVAGALVAAVATLGDFETAWTFSALTVLVYYAITNLAALRLPPEHRRFPRALAAAGLVSCLALACWIEPRVWLAGLALLAAGFVMRAALDRRR
jgi:basic amino acid/polyamine antiporter, APA family